ncbi:MAG: prolipoprotein diacylglyceryl transferase, partial [Clostridia bacterium]|nr:prolipoprotein diacylglyceryl transferase [Clostridia bacterium]
YRGNLVSILNIRAGGMAIYGGLIGGAAAGLVFAGRKKLSFIKLFDLAAPSIALGQAIGRWGNFINQEAFGVRISNPALCFFPLSVYIPSENAYFAATFFYESAWCFLIVFLCLLFEKKRLFRFPGAEACFYVSMYAFERMLVEGLRTDSLYLGPVRISQLLSVIALFAVFFLLFIRRKRLKRLPCAASGIQALCAIPLSMAGILPGFVLIVSGAALLAACIYEIIGK